MAADTTSIVRKGGKSHPCIYPLLLPLVLYTVWTHFSGLFRRGRSPQPPAEEEEEDFDENLVAIDTCEYNTKSSFPLLIDSGSYCIISQTDLLFINKKFFF